MSAEPVAPTPHCQECNRVWLPTVPVRRRCYLDDDDNLVFYCRECAEREFDDD